MSTSTDAILFYGFCLEEDEEAPWKDEDSDLDWLEWEDVYLKKRDKKEFSWCLVSDWG